MYYRLEIPDANGKYVGAARPVRKFDQVWKNAVSLWEHGHNAPPLDVYDGEAITGTVSMDMLAYWFPNLEDWLDLGARVMCYAGMPIYEDDEQVVFLPESGQVI